MAPGRATRAQRTERTAQMFRRFRLEAGWRIGRRDTFVGLI
jgi:hypothetical protein